VSNSSTKTLSGPLYLCPTCLSLVLERSPSRSLLTSTALKELQLASQSYCTFDDLYSCSRRTMFKKCRRWGMLVGVCRLCRVLETSLILPRKFVVAHARRMSRTYAMSPSEPIDFCFINNHFLESIPVSIFGFASAGNSRYHGGLLWVVRSCGKWPDQLYLYIRVKYSHTAHVHRQSD
jgi:hypothetical protein